MTVSSANTDVHLKTDSPYVYRLGPTFFQRGVALAYAGVLLAALVYLIVSIGPRFFSAMGLWATGLFASGILLMLRLAFPPKTVQPRLEFHIDKIVFVPGRAAKRFLGETDSQILLGPEAMEILFCRNFIEEAWDGARLIVRLRDGQERQLASSLRIQAKSLTEFAVGATSATGIPVRFITRHKSVTGDINESAWTPVERRVEFARGLTVISISALPYLAGGVAGYLALRSIFVVFIGFSFWVVQSGLLYFSPKPAERSRSFLPHAVITFFTFGAGYGLAFVVMHYLFRNN